MPVISRPQIVLLASLLVAGAGICLIVLSTRVYVPGAIRDRETDWQEIAVSAKPDPDGSDLEPVTRRFFAGDSGPCRIVQYHPFRLPFNVNSAPVEILKTIPGLDRRSAEKIVRYRESKGGITGPESLVAAGLGEVESNLAAQYLAFEP